MKNIERRVGKIEDALNIETDRELRSIIVTHREQATEPAFSEPVEEWLTYKRAREDAQRHMEETGYGTFVFVADRFKEYEARNGLPEGALSNHELRGNAHRPDINRGET